ncbi:MAG TPA: head GIN domain-containing protein [Allosphingosinicella sp.]|nr:head GIN domain-containing protein [Allosphingosinicella sp.]
MRAALLASAFALLAGCGDSHAQQGQRSFQVGAFDRINLAGSPDVVVAVGGQPSVRAEGDADAIGRLEIAVVDGELRIGMRPGSGFWGGHRGVTIHVTVPALQAASIEGSGDIRIDRVEGTRFAGRIGGSGDLDVTALRVGEASFSVRGSGDISAAGAAPRATLNVAGSGRLALGGFEAGDATISLAGSGDIALRATRTAAIQLDGSGDVAISGPARCTIAKSGSGDVRCGG